MMQHPPGRCYSRRAALFATLFPPISPSDWRNSRRTVIMMIDLP